MTQGIMNESQILPSKWCIHDDLGHVLVLEVLNDMQ